MAETKNGIVYPSNYENVADIPADLKKLAESVDNNISNIKEIDEKQDKNIEKMTENLAKANNEIIRLKRDLQASQLTSEESGERIYINNSSNARFNKFQVRGNYSQETPTVDNPSEIKTVKDNVNIKIASKNVLPIQNFTKTSGNFTCKYEDGIFTMSGVGKQEFAISEFVDFQSLSKVALNKTVTFSLQDYNASVPIEANMGSVSAYHFMQLKSASNTSHSKLVNENLNSLRFWLGSSDTTFNDVTFKLQIEIGNTKTSFEEHQEQTITMPVQQEMLQGDYFDFENEKEIHNWNKIENYNGETISTSYISTTGELSTGATVYYKLETPSELTFTDEQKTIEKQIKDTLHTYKNVTHIFSTDEISPNFNVEYAKDLNTAMNNIQVQVINNASEEVNV